MTVATPSRAAAQPKALCAAALLACLAASVFAPPPAALAFTLQSTLLF